MNEMNKGIEELIRTLRNAGLELPDWVIEDIFNDAYEGIYQGKAPLPNEGTSQFCPHMNSIPGYPGASCCHALVVRCYNKDKLHERLREMVYHTGIHCRGYTTQVIFVTSQWHPDTYELHTAEVKRLRQDGVKIVLLLMGSSGVSVIPV